jgi:hypothetical protein
METTQVALTTSTDLSFEQAIERCRESLAAEGGGSTR